MKKYNWQQPDWPHFRYDLSAVYERLFAIAEKMGLVNGKVSHLPEKLQTETMINLMVEEAAKTSEIEGERINQSDIRSSIKNKLGLNPVNAPIHDKRALGIAQLMLDVRNTFALALSEEKILEWHKILFSGLNVSKIKVGHWRTHQEPMQIVSGRSGKQIVHFEAPPSKQVPLEMKRFISWFNSTAEDGPQAIKFPPVRAAIAHLYFESIHPFEDGNGRIGRVIAEKALSQGFGYPVLLSLSRAIETEKKQYYAALHVASQSNEITDWIHYFVDVVNKAQIDVETQINFILKKSVFFDRYKNSLNERQLKVINRMMRVGSKFAGGMTAKKYMAITNTTKSTATRDLQYLHSIGALVQMGGGRSIRYELNL